MPLQRATVSPQVALASAAGFFVIGKASTYLFKDSAFFQRLSLVKQRRFPTYVTSFVHAAVATAFAVYKHTRCVPLVAPRARLRACNGGNRVTSHASLPVPGMTRQTQLETGGCSRSRSGTLSTTFSRPCRTGCHTRR